MTDQDNLLEPKVNRPPEEIGREVMRLAKKHGAVRVEPGESEWDVAVYPAED